jgi:hypothetical protein
MQRGTTSILWVHFMQCIQRTTADFLHEFLGLIHLELNSSKVPKTTKKEGAEEGA